MQAEKRPQRVWTDHSRPTPKLEISAECRQTFEAHPGDGGGRGELPPGLLHFPQILILVEQVLGGEEATTRLGKPRRVWPLLGQSGERLGTVTCPCSGSSLPSCSEEKLSSSSSE